MQDARAAAVAALGAAVLAGCTSRDGGEPSPSAPPSTSPSPADPDTTTLRRWLATAEGLSAAYAAHPRLAALRAHHAAHAAAIRAELPAGEPSPSPTRVTDLAGAETAAALAFRTDAVRMSTPARVVLGAELAASSAQHAAVLRA